MSNTQSVVKSAALAPGYLKFYMSHTAFFLEGGYLIDLPINDFHQFVFTHIHFIKQGGSDTGIDDKYGDAFIVNAGDASAYKGMTTKKLAAIKSWM
jgi:hypothetical protein